MQVACEVGDLETIVRLVQGDKNLVTAYAGKLDPLRIATLHKHSNVVKYLLEQGAPVDDRILRIAAMHGSIAILDMLLAHIDVDARDEMDETALHWCSIDPDNQLAVEHAAHLIAKGADLKARCVRTMTPLMYACRNAHVNLCYLFIMSGADVNAKRNNGYTALHFAVDAGIPIVCQMLVAKGADPFCETGLIRDFPVSRTYTPIELAEKNGFHVCARANIDQNELMKK